MKKRQEAKGGSEGAYRPILGDFSEKKIKQELTLNAFKHWLVQYPAAAAVLSVAGGCVLGFTEPFFWAAVGTLGVGAFSWVWQRFCLMDKNQRLYIEKVQKDIEAETNKKRRRLLEDLTNVGCERGVKQLQEFEAEFDSLISLLRQKLDQNEITYQRYYAMSQGVFLAGIDNLRKVLETLQSVDQVNVSDLEREIRQLRSPKCSERNKEGRAAALNTRIENVKRQQEAAEDLLDENEQALAQLNTAGTEIAKMDAGLNEGKLGMAQAMEELMIRIKQAKEKEQAAKQANVA
jgi:hypothetical protein